ncbi:MAG: (2Fe-2S)-binding protein, partial [Candidatus Bathyarchaeia archaeon]
MGKLTANNGRIEIHPVLKFDRGQQVTFYFEGKPINAYENETVASALYANGVRIFSRSMKYHRPRGFFCAIGRCSACLMTVDGMPNVRTCVLQVKEGLRVERQNAFPNADHDVYSFADKLSYISLAKGFYYRKLIHPSFLRNFYMNILTRFAGLGRIPTRILNGENPRSQE